MTREQFYRVLRKLQACQRRMVGYTTEFRCGTYCKQDGTPAIDFYTSYKEKFLRSGTITENDDYNNAAQKVRDFMDYMKQNGWI